MKVNNQSISKVCSNLGITLMAKNRDYGNSVELQFEEYGLTSILIRLDDKMKRLKNLKDKAHFAIDESLKDTLLDLAGYALLGYLCLEEDKKMEVLPEQLTEEWLKQRIDKF